MTSMYTIERMRPTEHSAESWSTLFGCDEGTHREFKLMCNNHVIGIELTFREAHEEKAYYEAEDAYALEEDEREEAEREEAENFIGL